MRKLFTIILSTVTFVTISCRKPDMQMPAGPQLPPITQSGKNTFGCLVDGKVWLPNGGGMLSSIETEYNSGTFYINSNQSNNEGLQAITFSIHPVYGDTIILITNDTGSGGGQWSRFAKYVASPYSHDYYYPIGQPNTGELTITKLDTTNRIMAGTFWFDAIDTVTSKTVKIREGRFDLTY